MHTRTKFLLHPDSRIANQCTKATRQAKLCGQYSTSNEHCIGIFYKKFCVLYIGTFQGAYIDEFMILVEGRLRDNWGWLMMVVAFCSRRLKHFLPTGLYCLTKMQQEWSKNCCSKLREKKRIFYLITGLDIKQAASQEDGAKITPYAYQAVLCPLEKKGQSLGSLHFRVM